jgi:hypothetical protein
MRTIKLPAGKYKIRRLVPARNDSWRSLPGGAIKRPEHIPVHWAEIVIRSDDTITITPV